jgi:hypothetical protein
VSRSQSGRRAVKGPWDFAERATTQFRREEELVEVYDFEILRGEEIIWAERLVQLSSPLAAWPKIIKLAKSVKFPQCRIRVKEQAGATIILVGVAVALRFADFDFLESV